MKIKKNPRLIAGMAVLMLLVGFRSYAQHGRGQGPGYGHGYEAGKGMNDNNIERPGMETILGLTEEQIKGIEEIRLGYQKESLPTVNKIGEKRAQLRSMISENADISKIDRLIDDIGQLQISLRKQRVKAHLQTRELLTQEQKIIFDSHFGNQFAWGGEHFRSLGMHGGDLR